MTMSRLPSMRSAGQPSRISWRVVISSMWAVLCTTHLHPTHCKTCFSCAATSRSEWHARPPWEPPWYSRPILHWILHGDSFPTERPYHGMSNVRTSNRLFLATYALYAIIELYFCTVSYICYLSQILMLIDPYMSKYDWAVIATCGQAHNKWNEILLK